MLPRVDEATVRQHAEAHGGAVVEGDLRRAGGDLDADALVQAGEVMKQLPRTIRSADVESVEAEGDASVVRTRYRGDEGEGVVESRWEQRGDRPKIVSMRVV
jgi:hypothetical protein